MPENDIMKIEHGEQSAQPAVSIRAIVAEQNLGEHVEKSYKKIISYLDELGTKPNGAPFIAYYDIDTENLRGNGFWNMEIGFPVSGILPGKGEIKSSVILGGESISCLYKGAYKGLGKAYTKLTEWLNRNHCHSMNISYEYFYNSPAVVPEEELLTKIVFLVKSADDSNTGGGMSVGNK